ncbi:hypothetical protein K440DRAFT_633551 [Wilcoxina mikolae CBS 423.85]|nr:hypothetical protein K440DRAFT_633551 [Wilcoxina mikolae CBS 423.85]
MTPSPKCFVTLAKPPAKKKPFLNTFNHQIDLILPTGIYDIISQSLLSCPSLATPLSYRRLVMPLSTILEPSFFNTLIKSGNILLLSHGRLDVENSFCLSDGVLRMSLDTETYERAGLQGKPSKFGNGPGLMKRRRFLVELNLRSTSYLTGSKSFNRLKRACDTVFQKPQVFLFADLSLSNCAALDPPATSPSTLPAPATPEILNQFPARTITPQIDSFPDVLVPSFKAPPNSRPHGGGKSEEANYHREVWRDWAMEIYEYLSLLLLPSGPADRIKAADSVDTYLSTYAVDDAHPDSITRIRLSGLIPARWVDEFWGNLEGLLEGLPEDKAKLAWAGMVVHGFDDVPVGPTGKQRGSLERCGNAYTMLKLPEEGGVMVWDLAGGQSE